jgi:hypothetical protein
MTVMFGWLNRLIRVRHPDPDVTEALINEAERTRHELLRITNRLAEHVAELKAFSRAYARSQEGHRSG